MIPDLDVVGFRFGIHYGDFLGHRGFTHSLAFAIFLAGSVLIFAFSRGVSDLSRPALWVYLFLATASHGFLDAMTDGGLGVALFAPSTTHATSCPGLRSAFRRLASADSLALAA